MDVVWGEPHDGVRLGLGAPREVETGSAIILDLVCENGGKGPVMLFGFQDRYPRSLRVSPPKTHRPHIRVSFGDTTVLHPPEAFLTVPPGGRARTGLDMSFAFDRRGVGEWPIAFAYDPVRASGRLAPFTPAGEASTGVLKLVVTAARSLRHSGIDETLESDLDTLLLEGSDSLVGTLRALGEGGARYAVRRATRMLAAGTEAGMGWRAGAALVALGDDGLRALADERSGLPHAHRALVYLETMIRHLRGEPTRPEHLPFATMLDRLIEQPEMRGNFLLSFTAVDSPVHGHRRLEILGNGERLVSSRSAGATMGSTRRSMLSSGQMRAVLEALRAAPAWLLMPLREAGLPDEPMPTLEVQLALGEPFSRRVAMWNGEWRMGPGAPLFDLLERLANEGGRESSLPPPPGSLAPPR